MSDRDKINDYMRSLHRFLAPLEPREADEVVREIESHIYDAIEERERADHAVDVDILLDGFGTPRELAQGYVAHIRTGAPPPLGFRAIRTVSRGMSVTLYYAVLLCGYGFGLFLIAVGAVNLFLWGGIGVAATDGGNSIVIGLADELAADGYALLLNGLWITPLAIVAGAGIVYLTFRVLRLLDQLSARARYV